MITFKDKINNIIDNQKSVSLRFLSLNEQAQIINLVKDKSLYNLEGGYPEAELKRAYFYHQDNLISCFKITANKHITLTHQNILGTLLSLSITKDSIGDILPKQGIFFTTKEIEKEVLNSFTKINNVPIEISLYNNDIKSEQELSEARFTTDSMRLDLIVSKITCKSRNESNDIIKRELVKVNHIVTTKHTKTITENDIISIRKYGRYIILDNKNTSKKGKIIVKYAKYI